MAAAKVSPYPIPLQILKGEGQAPHPGVILKIEEIGFLMNVDASQFYKVGECCLFQFELPASRDQIRVEGVIIKTYDGLGMQAKGKAKIHMIEVHFKNLSETDRIHLNTYLVKSGQKK